MTIRSADEQIVLPTLDSLPSKYCSREARFWLLVIGHTESGFRTRLQKPVAHAKGFWQFERNGGCAEFEQHPRLKELRQIASAWGANVARTATWHAIGGQADYLACLMARGLLWIDPAPLPAVSALNEGYAYYLRRWRPGKPSPSRFEASWAAVSRDWGMNSLLLAVPDPTLRLRIYKPSVGVKDGRGRRDGGDRSARGGVQVSR